MTREACFCITLDAVGRPLGHPGESSAKLATSSDSSDSECARRVYICIYMHARSNKSTFWSAYHRVGCDKGWWF